MDTKKLTTCLQAVIKVISVLIICASAFIAVWFFKAEIRPVFLFLIFLLFFVLLPGNLVIGNLKLGTSHVSTVLARSFFAGFALIVLLYYLSALVGIRWLILLICPLLSAYRIYKFLREEPGEKLRRLPSFVNGVPASFFLFAACVFLCSLLTTQFKYVDPDFSPFSLMRQDFGFHAGIINALAEGFPPKNPWIDGRIITYHYFSEMILSVPVRLLGVTSDELLMNCTPYLITPIFCLSLYSFFREMSRDGSYAGLYCLAFHFSNMFMLKNFDNSWFLYHIYSNVNNAGFGLSCLLTTIPLLSGWEGQAAADDQSTRGSKALLLASFVMLMTGLKGPVAVVLIGGMVGTFLLALIMRKANRQMFSAVVLSSISFTLIYIYVLAGEHSNASGGEVLNFGEVTDLFYLKDAVLDIASGLGLPRSGALVLLLAVFTVFYLTAFILPFVIGFIREFVLVVTSKKEFSFCRITVYACCVVGFLALMLFNFSGHSQVYFGFVTSVLVPAVAFWFFEDVRENRKVYMHGVRAVFAVMLCFFAFTMVLYMKDSAASSAAYYHSQDKHLEKYRDLSQLEYQGLIWLRENTDEDSLCASDRFNSVAMKKYDYTRRNNNTHFAYAIYSQRRQYLEGSGFSLEADETPLRKEMLEKNSRLYDPENEKRGDDARALGVDYVIVSKRFNDYGDLSNKDYELCYSNDEMDIYKIAG